MWIILCTQTHSIILPAEKEKKQLLTNCHNLWISFEMFLCCDFSFHFVLMWRLAFYVLSNVTFEMGMMMKKISVKTEKLPTSVFVTLASPTTYYSLYKVWYINETSYIMTSEAYRTKQEKEKNRQNRKKMMILFRRHLYSH